MATGYEQVRSVVAEIAGDHAAAREVRLVLPETGVCSAAPVAAAAAIGLLRRSRSGRGRRLLRARRRGEGRGQGRLRLWGRGARVGLGVTARAHRPDRRRRVIAALGIIQILAWGSSYYLLAVLAGPIARDTGWSYAWVIAGVSLGLLVAGAVSIRVGRTIEEYGGRQVLAASALLLAAGLAVMAMAPGVPIYLAAWLLLGAGMGAGLYDAAFSTLGRLYGAQARSAITQLTLWGGFASTVCWPLSAWLVEAVGWRGACLAYAGLHLAVTLPLALFAIPREARRELVAAQSDAAVLPGEASGQPRADGLAAGGDPDCGRGHCRDLVGAPDHHPAGRRRGVGERRGPRGAGRAGAGRRARHRDGLGRAASPDLDAGDRGGADRGGPRAALGGGRRCSRSR